MTQPRFLLFPVAAAFATFATAIWTAAPGLPPLDAGDLVAASHTLGVPHATGFPSWVASAATVAGLPLGDAASRVAWTSALWAAIAAGLATHVLAGQSGRALQVVVATVTVLATATLVPLALHTRVAEVYAMQTALAWAVIACLQAARGTRRVPAGPTVPSSQPLDATHTRATSDTDPHDDTQAHVGTHPHAGTDTHPEASASRPAGTPPHPSGSGGGVDLRWLALAGVFTGVGLANHALFRLWAPVLLLGAVWIAPPGMRLRAGAIWLMAAAIPQLAWVYLPAAASRPALHNWGDPSTLLRWWNHVMAADIRAAFGDRMLPSFVHLQQHVQVLGLQILPHGALLLAPVGALLLRLRRPHRALPVVVAGVLAVEVAYSVALNPMGLRDAQNGMFAATALPGAIVVASAWLAHRFATPPPLRPLVVGTVALAVAVGCVLRLDPRADVRRDRAFEDLGVIHAGLALPGAPTTVLSDNWSATLLYLQVVGDVRPDACWTGRWVFERPWLYAAWLQGNRHCPPILGNRTQIVQSWLIGEGGYDPPRWRTDVHWEDALEGTDLPPAPAWGRWSASDHWPLRRAVPPARAGQPVGLPPLPDRAWPVASVDPPFASAARQHNGALGHYHRHWLASGLAAQAATQLRAGQPAHAEALFHQALVLRPDSAALYNGVAVTRATQGKLEGALQAIDSALSLEPDRATALQNGVRYAEAAGDAARLARYREIADRFGVVLER